jgi:YD repeat-containing protein
VRVFDTGQQSCGEPDPDYGYISCSPFYDSVHTYSYDLMGNRTGTAASDTAAPLWSVTGTYATGNRIQSFAGCNYTLDSLTGEVTRRACGADTTRFGWDADGRLSYVRVVGGDSVAFSYDPLGRLVRRDTNGYVESNFLWEGENLFAELSAAGARVVQFSYYGLDRLHAFTDGTNYAYAHTDALGNVRALTDPNGLVTRRTTMTRSGR